MLREFLLVMSETVYIRPAREGDYSALEEIDLAQSPREGSRFSLGLDKEAWESFLSRGSRNRVMVVEVEKAVVGYVSFSSLKETLLIWRLAVLPEQQRKGYGSLLVERLLKYLNRTRGEIIMDVPEEMLDSQLFLKNVGFRAVSFPSGRFTNSGNYRFRFLKRSR